MQVLEEGKKYKHVCIQMPSQPGFSFLLTMWYLCPVLQARQIPLQLHAKLLPFPGLFFQIVDQRRDIGFFCGFIGRKYSCYMDKPMFLSMIYCFGTNSCDQSLGDLPSLLASNVGSLKRCQRILCCGSLMQPSILVR